MWPCSRACDPPPPRETERGRGFSRPRTRELRKRSRRWVPDREPPDPYRTPADRPDDPRLGPRPNRRPVRSQSVRAAASRVRMTAAAGHLRLEGTDQGVDSTSATPEGQASFPPALDAHTPLGGRHPPPAPAYEMELIGDLGDAWIGAFRTAGGPALRLGSCEPSGLRGDRMVLWLDAEVEADNLGRVVEEIHRRTSWQVLDCRELSPDTSSLQLEGPMPPLCAAKRAIRARCLSCPFVAPRSKDDKVSWSILTYRREDVRRLRNAFASACSAHAELAYFGRFRGTDRLTARQSIVLSAAYRLGRFDVPSGISIRGVAGELGISQTTADLTLRRGLRRMLAHRFDG